MWLGSGEQPLPNLRRLLSWKQVVQRGFRALFPLEPQIPRDLACQIPGCLLAGIPTTAPPSPSVGKTPAEWSDPPPSRERAPSALLPCCAPWIPTARALIWPQISSISSAQGRKRATKDEAQTARGRFFPVLLRRLRQRGRGHLFDTAGAPRGGGRRPFPSTYRRLMRLESSTLGGASTGT